MAPVLDVGTVTYTFDGAAVTLVEVANAAGWSVEVEINTSVKVEIKFEMGEDRVDFTIEVEDGVASIRIRDRRGE